MAALKVKQLRGTLGKFIQLYERAGAREQAAALRRLADSLEKTDHLSVDEVMRALQKIGQNHHLSHTGGQKH